MPSNHKLQPARIHELRRDGYLAGMTDDKLDEEGRVTTTQKNGYNERLVPAILHRYGTVERWSETSTQR
jgi:hypothetical protein